MTWTLDQGLAEISCGGLLILAESGHDPDLAPFVGAVHIGDCFLIRRSSTEQGGDRCWLAYMTAMERDEAASTGLRLLDPGSLGVDTSRHRHGASAAFWSEVVERGLEMAGMEPTALALGGRLSLGAGHLALSGLADQGWHFKDGRELLLRYRKRKTIEQIDQIRRSAAGVCAAFRRCAGVLASVDVTDDSSLSWSGGALTAGVLRRIVAEELARFGLGQPRDNIVAAGAEAGVPHTQGSDERILLSGESIVIDLFPKGALFADCTRTFCVGEAPDLLEAAHRSVRGALEQAYAEAKLGIRMWELQEKTCEFFARDGRSTPISNPGTTRGYVHGLGHGVGFEIHEYPSFAQNAGDEGVLEPGDVFTLEPGLYNQDAGYGVRLEDLCLATETGIENLTQLPYALDPRSWN